MRWLGFAVLLALVPVCLIVALLLWAQRLRTTAALAALTAVMLFSGALELARRKR